MIAHRALCLAALLLGAGGCANVEEKPPPAPRSVQATPPPVVKPPVLAKVAPAPTPTLASPPPVAEPVRANEVETLVAEFARLRRLPPAELAREQEAARQSFSQSRSESSRVRLAMALGMPGTQASDESRALDLLEPLLRSPTASLHALAVLLSAYLQEQRRLDSQIAGLQQNVQGLQQNVHGLQQKLDALTNLERSLSGRGGSSAVRRR